MANLPWNRKGPQPKRASADAVHAVCRFGDPAHLNKPAQFRSWHEGCLEGLAWVMPLFASAMTARTSPTEHNAILCAATPRGRTLWGAPR